MSNPLKTAALGVYRRATVPYRIWAANAARRNRRTPLMMLYYHRVSDRESVAWSMKNAQFRRQIDWLEQLFDMGEVHELADIDDEIVLARRELAETLQLPIRYFAFPFGMPANLNHAAAAMARADGVEAVVSAYGGHNTPGEDSFQLQRCHGAPELERIRNAVTFDPRHVRKEKYNLKTQGPTVEAALAYYAEQNPPPSGTICAIPNADSTLSLT